MEKDITVIILTKNEEKNPKKYYLDNFQKTFLWINLKTNAKR